MAAGKRWTYRKRGYALTQSLRQLRQRKLSSLTTLLVLGVTLALPIIIFFSAGSLQQLGTQTVNDESLTLYLEPGTGDLEAAKLAESLLSRNNIRDTLYVSPDEALAMFKAHTDIGDAVAALDGNPLPGAIVVYPQSQQADTAAVKNLAETLGRLPLVERVQFDLRWVKRLHAMLSLLRLIGWLLAGFLTLTALLVIGNTIRLELLRRQPEIDVSRLLGASASFMRRPMLYTGALYGFLGGLIACALATLALLAIKQPVDELSGLYTSVFRLEMPTASQFGTVLAITTALGLLGAGLILYRPSRQI
jgi:cell division transport system permease protein